MASSGQRDAKQSLHSGDTNSLLIITLGVMMAYNSLDLIAWRLVMEDVKLSLGLSDTQLGLLSGFAYSIFYAVMGLPMARWADRGYRAVVLAAAAALSGIMVTLIGVAQTFAYLLVIRIAVAVGDAGCTPVSQSLIASQFARRDRPRATALVLVGATTSGILGPPLIGWLNESFGWRATFVAIGLPGLILAALAWLILRRFDSAPQALATNVDELPASTTSQVVDLPKNYRHVLANLWSTPTFRWVVLGWLVSTFLGAGIAKWEAVFFRRVHGLETGTLGLWLGLVAFVGMAGIYGGGYLATRYAANDERLQLKALGVIFGVISILAVGVYLAPDYRIAMALLALRTLGGSLVAAPIVALLQTLAPRHARATAFSVFVLFNQLIGGGIGPLAVGALSDALHPLLGSMSIKYALIASCPGYLLGGWCLWRASRTAMADIARASDNERQEPGNQTAAN